MIKLLWSHIRDIRVEAYQNKIVYDIPLYNETISKLFSYKVEFLDKSNTLRLTIRNGHCLGCLDCLKPTIGLCKKSLD